jgi:hypothetical protein
MMALALAACGRAEAVPPSAVQPPAGWQPLAALATAAREAAQGEGITVDGAQAWGETAMGCYALAVSVRGAASAKDFVVGLGGITVHDLAEGSGTVALAFDKGEYKGKLHASLGESGIEAVACFWNQREPLACATACDGMLK